jgi:NAD(P)-dependent dehydrogenase (short-subunit alcohol dehydrogenase family)
MPTAIVTGASRGLGEAIVKGLVGAGWTVVTDARGAQALEAAAAGLPEGSVRTVPGDINDADHIDDLIAAAGELGGLELVVNNASSLGPSPLPPLAHYPLDDLRSVIDTNVVGPLALVQAAAPLLRGATNPRVVNVTSDASVEAYAGWGGYGASKAALDHLGAVLAAEEPSWKIWTVDPGDLRTQMHQDAFPGEDISDRPEPESVVPAFLALVESDRPSGRLKLSEVAVPVTGGSRP